MIIYLHYITSDQMTLFIYVIIYLSLETPIFLFQVKSVGRETGKAGIFALLPYEFSSLLIWSAQIKMSLTLQFLSDKMRALLQNTDTVFSSFRRYLSMRQQRSKVQALYDHCKTIFTPSGNPPPSSQEIQKLYSILGISFPEFSFFRFLLIIFICRLVE